MANTTLTQTGAQVQVDLNKVEGMAEIKTVGSGLTLSSAGELSASGGGTAIGGGYTLTIIDPDGGSYDGPIYILGTLNGVFGWHKHEFYEDVVYTNVVCFQNTTIDNGLSIETANAILNALTGQYMPVGYINVPYRLFMLSADATLKTNF